MKRKTIIIIALCLLCGTAALASKITDYLTASSPSGDDYIIGVDVSDTTQAASGTTKKYRLRDLPVSDPASAALMPKAPVCLAAAPVAPENGQIECANGSGWQIDVSQGTDDWLVRYRVADDTWVGIYDLTNGQYIVSEIDEQSLAAATIAKLSRYHQTAHIDPDNQYANYDGTIVLDPKTAAAFTISEISVYLNEDPAQELTVTLYHKTAAIGYTGGTTIGANDTVAGTFTATTFDDATIPAGSKIWLVIGDDPDVTTTDMEVVLTGAYD